MSRVVDTNMVELYESKLDVVLKAIEALLVRTNYIKDFMFRINNNHEAPTLQTNPSIAS